MLIDKPLQSPRLLLRTLTDDDVGRRYLDWLGDAAVSRYLEVRFTQQTEDSLRRHVDDLNASADTLFLGIFVNHGGPHIGNIKLGPIDSRHRSAPIGIIIGDRDHWGRGYASEAIETLSAHAFGTLKLHKLYAGCYSANVGSIKAFLKVGFAEEGRMREQWLCDGERQDDVLLGLVNDTPEA